MFRNITLCRNFFQKFENCSIKVFLRAIQLVKAKTVQKRIVQCEFGRFSIFWSRITVATGIIALFNHFISCSRVVVFITFHHSFYTNTPIIVEFLCVLITDIVSSRRTSSVWLFFRCMILRGYQIRYILWYSGLECICISISFHSKWNIGSITGTKYISLQICAENCYIRISEPTQHIFCGMSIRIVFTDRDNGIPGCDITKEQVWCTAFTTVVSNFEDCRR